MNDVEKFLQLLPEHPDWMLTEEEFFQIAQHFGGFWRYNYEAAKKGRFGNHAELKSGRCSDGFFWAAAILDDPVICQIMAQQLVNRYLGRFPLPDYIAGIPKGASKLGEAFAKIVNIPVARLEKVDGRIQLIGGIPSGKKILLIEDVCTKGCTKGTGFTEAVKLIYSTCPAVNFIPAEPVIINRGGLEKVIVELAEGPSIRAGLLFKVMPIVTCRINDWAKEECPLCKIGSLPIQPKKTADSWDTLINSQV